MWHLGWTPGVEKGQWGGNVKFKGWHLVSGNTPRLVPSVTNTPGEWEALRKGNRWRVCEALCMVFTTLLRIKTILKFKTLISRQLKRTPTENLQWLVSHSVHHRLLFVLWPWRLWSLMALTSWHSPGCSAHLCAHLGVCSASSSHTPHLLSSLRHCLLQVMSFWPLI